MFRAMMRRLRRPVGALALVALTVLAVRAWDSQRGPALQPWHTFVPAELTAEEIDKADWATWLGAEEAVFRSVDDNVARRLPDEERVPENRYFALSPLNPARFARDWNRSFVLEPDGPPKGAVVLLHGLTDAPFSLRHVAQLYRDNGFIALAIRLPGHGTVPGGLTDVSWQDWLAATRLGVREAARRIGPDRPLHLVGYSNGGALALKFALDALEDPALRRPDRVVLMSPMIGVTRFARFAGLAGLPAYFPAFAKAAWLSVVPEFNPFKYNSFPVNAATQSHRLTQVLQASVRRRARAGVIEDMAPVLTFQSVMDFTVSTSTIVSALYAHLPRNGSELVLFDINRSAKLGPLLKDRALYMVERLLPPPPQAYRSVVVTNAGPEDPAVVARVVEAGSRDVREIPLGLAYPRDVYSLSHVAIPFPTSDGLYGTMPDPAEDFGVRLGTVAARGEVGVLVVNLETLMRMTSNPFFPFLATRVVDGIADSATTRSSARAGSR